MYMTTIMLIMVLISTAAPFTSSIITMGAVLILSAFMSTLMVSLLTGSWFGFILFLIYITGLLVLFSYTMAMSPNNFNSKMATVKTFVMLSGVTTLTTLYSHSPSQLMPLSVKNSFEMEVTQMYSNVNLTMYWLMAMILLIALLMTVNLCYKSPKPLRSFLE